MSDLIALRDLDIDTDLAKAAFGAKGEPSTQRVAAGTPGTTLAEVYGWAQEDSDDGTVWVVLDNAEGTLLEIASEIACLTGDYVRIRVSGYGPVAVGVVGGGDRLADEVTEALTAAQQSHNDAAAAQGAANAAEEAADAATQASIDAAEAAAQAIRDAEEAARLADAADKAAKVKHIYTSQPAPPYSKDDLWINGTTTKVCSASRATGSFNAADWTAVSTGITGTTVMYQASANGTTAPTGTWSTSVPAVAASQYLWTRTAVSYSDGTGSVSYSVGMMGAKGDAGDTGAAGRGISGTAVTYQKGTSGITPPTGTWTTAIPAVGTSEYLWTRTVTTYTDATTTTAYSVGLMGAQGPKGDTGDAGRGISSTAITYQAGASGTTIPTGTWLASVPAVSASQYLWTRTVTTYTSGDPTTAYSVGMMGATGAKGDTGTAGTSVTVSSTAITYQQGDSGTTKPTGTWATTIPAVAKGKYLWTKTVVTYSDGKSTEAHSVAYIPTDGANGTSVTIASTAVTYQQSTSGTTTPTGTWLAAVPAITKGQFMWTRTVVTYSDGKSTTSYSVAYNAVDGATGAAGAAGKGISSVAVAYAASTSGVTAPTTWQSAIPTVSASQYLWTRTTTNYTSGDPTVAYSVGMMGAQGTKGDTGTAGTSVSITSTAVTYQQSTSGTAAPTGTWLTSVPTPVKGQFMWTRTVVTYSDGTSTTAYSVAYNAVDGTTGAAGAAGKGISSVAVTYQASTSGTTTPTGTWLTSVPTVAAGQYLWTRTIVTYTDNATSTAYSMGMMGATGKGVSSTAAAYQLGTSGTTAPTGTWATSVPTLIKGQYLWARTVLTYTDSTTSTTYSVSYIANDGAAGKGISSTAVTYQAGASGVTAPTGTWTTAIPTVAASQYLWTRTVITYTDATTSTSYAVGLMGANGSELLPNGDFLGGLTGWFRWGGSSNTSPTTGMTVSVVDDTTLAPYTKAFRTEVGATSAGSNSILLCDYIKGLPAGKYVMSGYAKLVSGTVANFQTGVSKAGASWTQNMASMTLTTSWQYFEKAVDIDGGSTWRFAFGPNGCSNCVFLMTGLSLVKQNIGAYATYADIGAASLAINVNAEGEWAAAQSFALPFWGYIGNARAACTAAVTGLPAGLTVGSNTAGTASADGSLVLNVAANAVVGSTATSGYFTVTLTCSSKAFPFRVYWEKAVDVPTLVALYDSKIEQANDQILLQVSGDYYLKTSATELSIYLQSRIEQTDKAIVQRFLEAAQMVGEEAATRESYIRATIDGLELGEANSIFKALFSSTKLAFLQNAQEVASISNQVMSITEAVVAKQLAIGKWLVTSTSAGNLTVKWKG
jgi:hypothetical protein